MDTTETIIVHIEYTSSDIVRACRVYQVTTVGYKFSKVVAIMCFAAGCWLAYARGLHWLTVVLFVSAVLSWFDPVRPLQAWLAFKRNPGIYLEPYQVTFDDTGVHAKTSTIDARRLWTGYSTVLEGETLFLLVYGKWLYVAIPKRVFASDEEIEGFRQMLERKIGRFD
jgi:hypothetical protein